MRLPIRQIAAFATSPKGRRMLQDARTKLDTPENRRRVADAVNRARRGRGGPGPGGSAGTSR